MARAARTRAATIEDVARLAGVSITTVSRVANANYPVAPRTAERVRSAMAKLSYTPSATARALATNTANTLALLIPDIMSDFFVPLLRGIQGVAHDEGFSLLISTASHEGGRAELPRPLAGRNADGLLVFAGGLTAGAIRQVHARGLPMVLIHQSAPEGIDVPSVTIENKAASFELVSHLVLDHGRRRVVLLRGHAEHEDAHWREVGYRQALERHGIVPDAALMAPGDFSREVAYASVTRLVREGTAFDAIFAGDDEAAVGALAALAEVGLRVPEDVSVVGFDDQRLAAVLTPSLTTVHAPTQEVGAEATRQLIALLRTGRASPLTLLPTRRVTRRSCGCQP